VRADVGFLKWPSGEHKTRAREGPAAAGASTGTGSRFFAGCGSLPAGPAIGAWSPDLHGSWTPVEPPRSCTPSG